MYASTFYLSAYHNNNNRSKDEALPLAAVQTADERPQPFARGRSKQAAGCFLASRVTQAGRTTMILTSQPPK